MIPYHVRVWQELEQNEKDLELDDRSKRQLNKNKEHILSQKVQLRLQQTKCEGMESIEDDDFKISFNIRDGN